MFTSIPLKTSEKWRFSYVFRGYRSGTLVEKGLIKMKEDPHSLHNCFSFKMTLF